MGGKSLADGFEVDVDLGCNWGSSDDKCFLLFKRMDNQTIRRINHVLRYGWFPLMTCVSY